MKVRVLCSIVALGAVCNAQPDLSVRQAIEQAMSSHPLIQAAASRTEVSEGLRRQAGLGLNPKLVLQLENVRPPTGSPYVYWRDNDNFAYLHQTFETAGKRQRRVETAQEVVRRSELEQEVLKRQVSGRVAGAYWTAAGAARALGLLVRNQETFAQVVHYHEVRVKEGAMAEADLIRVQLEAQRLAIAVNQARLEAERARINLFREMGRAEFPEVKFADPVEGALQLNPAVDTAAAVENRPEARLARAALTVTKSNVRLQEANGKPNFDVLLGYKRTTGFNTMLGGFQMDLPFVNRNQGNIDAAAADVKVAEANVAATEALIRAEVQAARTDYEIRRRELTSFFQPLLERAGETYRIAEAAYREGGTDLLRLLDAQRVRQEAETSYARGLVDLRLSLVNLNVAMGAEP